MRPDQLRASQTWAAQNAQRPLSGGHSPPVDTGIDRTCNSRRTKEDDGPGISPGELGRIFEPFYTTKGTLGTGLGGATVDRMIWAAEGEIEVRSELGEGTTFTIELPRLDDRARTSRPSELRE